ncbi:MAG TPA: helix-turn-helix domain-containing protein [Geminicoccaceae bacterium]|nr:helix-turn-helix domain-containing protein [Geminicoccus sp.]HMU53204.1 helix-turn-helix domain-containing protein [Geminicoccaceae bacterium]
MTIDERLPRRRSDIEIEDAAAGDPDAAPVRTEVQIEAMLAAEAARDVHGVAGLRRRLGISQVQFASRYRIPLSTIRQWEQGVREPDAASRLLLAVIAEDPALVARVASRAA